MNKILILKSSNSKFLNNLLLNYVNNITFDFSPSWYKTISILKYTENQFN